MKYLIIYTSCKVSEKAATLSKVKRKKLNC